jgi:hypothetical protein
MKWEDIRLPSFKETHGDFGAYLLARLQSGGEITVEDCSAQQRSGGFASASRFLKNTEKIKTVATALHIPGNSGAIDHYDIEIYRFKKEGKGVLAVWTKQEGFPLREDEVVELYSFLTEQNSFIGRVFEGKDATVIFTPKGTDAPALLQQVSLIAQNSGGRKMIDQLVSEIVKGTGEENLLTIGFTEDIIGKRRKELDAFEAVIDNPAAKEVGDIQAALKKIPWVFGPEYKSYDYRKAGDEIPDGRLKRVDGLSDILEVKLPSEEVLRVGTKGRRFISPKCAEAIGQLISYLEYYHSSYSTENDDETKEEILVDRLEKYYRPKGILLIGRRSKTKVNATKLASDNEPKFMRRILSYHHGIEILTFDDLLERARNALDNIQSNQGF